MLLAFRTLAVSPCWAATCPKGFVVIVVDHLRSLHRPKGAVQTRRSSSSSGELWNGWESGASVVVSVDWEGSGFDEEDLAAFRQFRDEFPEVPLTHYLNAAYFTRLTPTDVIGAVSTSDKIRAVLRDGDEIGLHVHADGHLLHAAGVPPPLL